MDRGEGGSPASLHQILRDVAQRRRRPALLARELEGPATEDQGTPHLLFGLELEGKPDRDRGENQEDGKTDVPDHGTPLRAGYRLRTRSM